MTSRFLSMTLLCAFFVACHAKPTEVLADDGSSALNPLQQQLIAAVETDVKRVQRSPQFGFPGEGFAPFPEFDDERRFENHHRHHHKHHHRPEGCGEFGCGGEGFGPQPGFYPSAGGSSESTAQASAGSNGFGGSVASANAGSTGTDGPFGGGAGSQANAQSASFNFGPYSASFSIAESSSGAQQPPIF